MSGKPRRTRRRWSDEFKRRVVAEACNVSKDTATACLTRFGELLSSALLGFCHQHDGCQAHGKGGAEVSGVFGIVITDARTGEKRNCHERIARLGLTRVSVRLWRVQAANITADASPTRRL